MGRGVCGGLEHHHHTRGVTVKTQYKREGRTYTYAFTIGDWPFVTRQAKRAWNDLTFAVEQAAYAIACLLVLQLTPYTIIERAQKGTGIDYFLGNADTNEEPFVRVARLEVSGILQGNATTVRQRAKEKVQQTHLTDAAALPTYIVIVEFGSPSAYMVKKDESNPKGS